MELIFTLDTLKQAVEVFSVDALKKYKVFLFDAEMGSGKTTFIKELCKQYGVRENVSSPTYSIINEYSTTTNRKVYHLDLYRIKDDEEAVQAGAEECIYSGDICFVEWPFKAPGILPDDAGHVTIEVLASGERKLTVADYRLADNR